MLVIDSGSKGDLRVSFLLTIENVREVPSRPEPRTVLLGRSNVGKSSLINALLKKREARVSKTPGRTQTVNWYAWNSRILADLPGYGFAQADHASRNAWARMAEEYLSHDAMIERYWWLWDSRHGPTRVDRDAIAFLSLKNVPGTIILTKSDQLKTQSDRARRLKEVRAAMEELGMASSDVVWVSSKTGKGIGELACM
jgi:GTP-binding protein